ncbi:organic solute transporter alpha-like protein [Phlebotomus argentipes]|uniref:organic solute transporter alpha-like protein n=1 Tax=Phlebotomus argentipes TaxID=94469 RepID=UPI002892BFFB|nr:organic solute transporter alpha-like protein [Phlebotomus argentipes]
MEGISGSDFKCLSGDLPSASELFSAISAPIVTCLAIGGCVLVTTIAIFWTQVRFLLENTPKPYKARTVTLCAIYQVVSLVCFMSMLIPRFFLMAEMAAVLTFGFAAYQITCLIIDYANGESNFIKLAGDNALNMRVPPFCLFYGCLRNGEPVTKVKFLSIRLLVGQFVVVQGVMYIMLNAIYVDEPSLYNSIRFYFMPFVIISLLSCIWGLNMITRMVAPYLPYYKIIQKYFAVQFVLLMSKIQPTIADIVVSNVDFPCNYPLTPHVYKNVVVHLVIVVQMMFLSIWAIKLYKKPLKKPQVHTVYRSMSTTASNISVNTTVEYM